MSVKTFFSLKLFNEEAAIKHLIVLLSTNFKAIHALEVVFKETVSCLFLCTMYMCYIIIKIITIVYVYYYNIAVLLYTVYCVYSPGHFIVILGLHYKMFSSSSKVSKKNSA